MLFAETTLIEQIRNWKKDMLNSSSYVTGANKIPLFLVEDDRIQLCFSQYITFIQITKMVITRIR